MKPHSLGRGEVGENPYFGRDEPRRATRALLHSGGADENPALCLVRMGRLELPRVAPLEPKSSASTSFATFAMPLTDVPRAEGIIRESGRREQMRRSVRPVMRRDVRMCRIRACKCRECRVRKSGTRSIHSILGRGIKKARCQDRALDLVGRPRLERGTY